MKEGISEYGYIYYLVWHSLLFCVGIALIHSVIGGFSDRHIKTNFLVKGFIILLPLLPGPFTIAIFLGIFPQQNEWFFYSSIIALAFAIYLIFRHKIIVNTPYETLKATLTVMNDILIKTDEAFRIEFVAGAYSTLLGYEKRDLIGQKLSEIVDEKYIFDAYHDYVFQGKMKESFFDAGVICKDGSRLPVFFSLTPILAGKEVIGFVAVGRDFRERKQFEEQLLQERNSLELRVQERTAELINTNKTLRESEEQFRLISENVADLIVVLDLEGRRVYNSPMYKNIIGDPSELRGSESFREIHPEDREKIKSIFKETVRTGIGQRAEYRFIKKDGTISHIESQGSVIRDKDGEITNVVVVSRDVTEKKLIEQQLMRMQRMESIGTLAGGVAHDLNNVLAPIMLAVELLKKSIPDARSQKILETLEANTHRGSAIVNQILGFARGVQKGSMLIQLHHIINEITNIIKETFPKSITFKDDIPKDIWTIVSDPTNLHQLMLNLCLNARDAMSDGGTIHIKAENKFIDEQDAKLSLEAKTGRYVMLSVEDTGCGMPPAVLERIFEPFFTTKGFGKGTGLGLSTVHAIVKSHGGFINVSSELGRGTTFKIYLPAAKETDQNKPKLEENKEMFLGHGELIMVVDDEIPVQQITKQILEAYGYRVITASDGAEAVVHFASRKEEIALVLTDMMMPIMDGPQTIRELRKINPEVKIIASSGLIESYDMDKVNEHAVDGSVAKPYNAEKLLEIVHSVLHKK
jgi:PAS domain S-box-containing protein